MSKSTDSVFLDVDGDEIVIAPALGLTAVEIAIYHDSGCFVCDDPKVIRSIAERLIEIAGGLERVAEAKDSAEKVSQQH